MPLAALPSVLRSSGRRVLPAEDRAALGGNAALRQENYPRSGGLETPAPLGVYVSVPFCRAKCTFCNFSSGVYPLSAMPGYVAALVNQLQTAHSWAQSSGLALPERIDTIYLGGGTPSLLPPDLLTLLIGTIREEFRVDPDAEITLEAAPLQLAPATLEAAQRAGVNRVSFGVQSFVDGEARAAARTHSGAEALAEIERVFRAGVPHVSADLIAGLPGQTAASWAHSVEALCAAPLDHGSVYMFELDGESRLGAEALRGGVRYGAQLLPHEDAVADWYAEACERLEQNGLRQYEISNFARDHAGRSGRSRHNERYWLRSPYLGVGADAHSMLRACGEAGAAARFSVGNGLGDYLNGATWTKPASLTPSEELEEAWFLGLRRNCGVRITDLEAEFGREAVQAYMTAVAELEAAALLHRPAEDTLALTARGRLLSNEVFGSLLSTGNN